MQLLFQHTAARRRLDGYFVAYENHICFNTQPPEGGWPSENKRPFLLVCFNTQPPEGGWLSSRLPSCCPIVSTHSRPKAAGIEAVLPVPLSPSFNTQPPEGGWIFHLLFLLLTPLFQHTAARRRLTAAEKDEKGSLKFQHTAARRRLGNALERVFNGETFQHTAARRRLVKQLLLKIEI